MLQFLLLEANTLRLLAPKDSAGKDWRVCVIESGWSLNDNFYPKKVLQASTPLFEKVKVFAYRFGRKLGNGAVKDHFDHLPPGVEENKPGGFAENLVGLLTNPAFETFKRPDGTMGEGICADFHVLEGHVWLRENLKDAWENGYPDILGLSINARGHADRGTMHGREGNLIRRIDFVRSTEVVTDPAAGGGMIKLVASIGESTMKGLLELIQKFRKSWLEGIDEYKEGQDHNDYILHVIETCAGKAHKAMAEIPATDTDRLLEQARGVNQLNAIMGMLKANKIDEAMAALQSMISSSSDEPKESFLYKMPKTPAVPPAAPAAPAAPAVAPAAAPSATAVAESALLEREKKVKIDEAELRVQKKVLACGLPEVAQNRVITLLAGRPDVSEYELEKAIVDEREYISKFSKDGKVVGLGEAHNPPLPSVEVTVEQRKKWDLAMDGFWSGKDEGGVEKFTGLKEAFAEIHGHWYSNEVMTDYIFESLHYAFPRKLRMQKKDPLAQHRKMLESNWKQIASIPLREAVTTADFPVIFGDALFRRLQKRYTEDPRNDWRQIVSNIANLKDATNTQHVIRTGEFDELPIVNENAPYQELTPLTPTEEEETYTPDKKGGLFKLTWEALLADRLGELRKVPDRLARTANITIHKAVWGEIESNPLMQDGVALINATHNNIATAAIGFDAVMALALLLRDQTFLDSGEKIGLQPHFLLTGTKLADEGFEIINSKVKANASEDATVDNSLKGLYNMVLLHTIGLGRAAATDDHFWVTTSPADADTIEIGFLGGRDRPDIFVQGAENPNQGAFFDSDAIQFKIRLVFGVQVIDHRWIAGSLQ